MKNLTQNKLTQTLLAASASVLLATTAQAAFISSGGDAALIGANSIDFESTAMGTYSSITVSDVTFSADDNHLRIDNTYQQYNQSGVYLDNGTYGNNGFNSMTMDFAYDVDAFGFTWGMAEGWASWVLTAYDATNNVLESYNLPSTQASSAGEFYGIAVDNIASATLVWTGNYDWIAVDNFTYTAGASVPEPGTLALFSLGLAGVAAARKKRV